MCVCMISSEEITGVRPAAAEPAAPSPAPEPEAPAGRGDSAFISVLRFSSSDEADRCLANVFVF